MEKDSKPLHGKRILFMSIKFFNYENLIKQELEALGASVDWYDERPSNTLFTKAMIRIRKSLVKHSIEKYFHSLMADTQNKKYDYFLLIKGETTPKFFLEYLRKANPDIKLIFYTWDSFVNNSAGQAIIKEFDATFSFDNDDAKKYGMKFRPLFFSRDYERINYEDAKESKLDNKIYDLSFIGTAHSDRYTIAEKVRLVCLEQQLLVYIYYYSASKLFFYLKKVFNNEFRVFDKNKISFISLSHSQIIDIFTKSKAILDINHPNQKGLTMRTFEALGASRKLVTTNSEILNYPFYNPVNVLIIDRNTPKINTDFFVIPFSPISPKVYEAMSLRGWCLEIFGLVPMIEW